MRVIWTIGLFLISLVAFTQSPADRVTKRMREFHQALIDDKNGIPGFIDDSLSYGHSNGWIENRNDIISNLGKRLIYHSFKEDSIKVGVNNDIAHIRLVADIDVTLDGKRNLFHLRILEVWVKRNDDWKLFARQAVR